MVWDLTSYLLIALYIFTIGSTILMMLMENRSPYKSIAWIVVLLIFPILGLGFYILVGRNFRKKFVVSHRSLKTEKGRPEETENLGPQLRSLPASTQGLANMVGNSCGANLYDNNQITLYDNGTSLFKDVFAEMEKAKVYLHVEYYVFNSDEVGNQFMDILKRKSLEGVKVRLIVDDVGSWKLKKSSVKQLRDAGVEVFCFMRVALPFLSSRVNYRNHRKIIIIDGKVGFTGGMNVADRYVKGTKWGCWRDTHLRVEGCGVYGLQKVFIMDWFFVSRTYLDDDNSFFPKLESNNGEALMQIVHSGPDTLWESIMQMFFSMIAQARSSVLIQTPYFLPNTQIVEALQTAALSGVDVRIILPRKSDAGFALKASCSYIDDMLKAGIKVYFYEPGFLHSKTIVVDGFVSTIGTANMDFRSFDQNFEVNTIIYDSAVASKLQQRFMDDLKNSTQIQLPEWNERPKMKKLGESWARLFSPLM